MAAYERRYSINGMGRQAKVCSHIVNSGSLRSLCGRNAADWFKMDDGPTEKVDCDRCRAAIAKATGGES